MENLFTISHSFTSYLLMLAWLEPVWGSFCLFTTGSFGCSKSK